MERLDPALAQLDAVLFGFRCLRFVAQGHHEGHRADKVRKDDYDVEHEQEPKDAPGGGDGVELTADRGDEGPGPPQGVAEILDPGPRRSGLQEEAQSGPYEDDHRGDDRQLADTAPLEECQGELRIPSPEDEEPEARQRPSRLQNPRQPQDVQEPSVASVLLLLPS